MPAPDRDPCAGENYQQTRRELADWMGQKFLHGHCTREWMVGMCCLLPVADFNFDPLRNSTDMMALHRYVRSKGFGVRYHDCDPECWPGQSGCVLTTISTNKFFNERGANDAAALINAAHAAMLSEKASKTDG